MVWKGTRSKHTQGNKPSEQPRAQTREVILHIRQSISRYDVKNEAITLDWNVNKVKPMKTPKVINLDSAKLANAWQGRETSTYKACKTIKLLKNATITPRVKASMAVKVLSNTRLRGWL